jgi:hypothetical protein
VYRLIFPRPYKGSKALSYAVMVCVGGPDPFLTR